MASYNKYNIFVEDLANGVHDIFGTTHTFKILLSNTAPNAATHAVKADATEISAGNGYVAGGVDIDNDATRTTGTVTVTAADKTITASGGTIGPFRYAVLYNDSSTSPDTRSCITTLPPLPQIPLLRGGTTDLLSPSLTANRSPSTSARHSLPWHNRWQH